MSIIKRIKTFFANSQKGVSSGNLKYTATSEFEKYAEMAKNGTLPKGFNQWGLKDSHGETVAHVAVEAGHIPDNFKDWSLADNYGWTVAHSAARDGYLPDDFGQWEMATHGVSVAHVAAKWGNLPDGFDKWELADNEGWTVAHEAAKQEILPENFDRWEIVDKRGITVVSEAMLRPISPSFFFGFDQWELINWELRGAHGTLAHKIALWGILPDDFDRWFLINDDFETVAHTVAEYGHLPEDFDWSLTKFTWNIDEDKAIDSDKYPEVYNIIHKYCSKKNESFQSIISEVCLDREAKNTLTISEDLINCYTNNLSDIIEDSYSDVSHEFKIEAKNKIVFFRDLINFQQYFDNKEISLSLDEILTVFGVTIRKINLEKNQSYFNDVYNAVKLMIGDDDYSEKDVIKNFMIYSVENTDPDDIFVSTMLELPTILNMFGFKDDYLNNFDELRTKCKQILDEINFEFNITSSYDDILEDSNYSEPSQQNNRNISSEVRREVWRRDQGKCVKCGSRVNLEFDHIVPVSKGGGNTARNVELLCQDCNRSKSDKIL